MTARAVRAWLQSTLQPAGLPVFDSPLAIGAAGDAVSFQRFPRRQEPLSFGAAGALVENTYTPSVLVWLMAPSSDSEPAQTLDGYVEALCDLIREAATPVTLNDAITHEASQLMLVGEIALDPAPANTLTATVIVPTLIEYATRSSG